MYPFVINISERELANFLNFHRPPVHGRRQKPDLHAELVCFYTKTRNVAIG